MALKKFEICFWLFYIEPKYFQRQSWKANKQNKFRMKNSLEGEKIFGSNFLLELLLEQFCL